MVDLPDCNTCGVLEYDDDGIDFGHTVPLVGAGPSWA